jgi:hypothetical protein
MQRLHLSIASLVGLLLLAACGGPPATSGLTVTAPPGQTATAAPTQPATIAAAEPTATTAPATTVVTAAATDTPTPTPESPTATPTQVDPTATPTTAATATQAPTSTPRPSNTPPPAAPRVISFSVVPTTTQTLGERLTLTWQAVGERAQICPIAGRPWEDRCIPVPLTGRMDFTSTEDTVAYDGLGLMVQTGDQFAWGVQPVRLLCNGWRDWFFANPPARCPETAPQRSAAAAQVFEHGFMVWVEASDTFYVFYEPDPGEQPTMEMLIGPAQLKPGASPDNRVGETPPPGLYEPVSGFGLLWRDELEGLSGVRQRLGWALAPEFGYDTARQCVMPTLYRGWRCYLQGPVGQVLEMYPDSTAQARFIWQER